MIMIVLGDLASVTLRGVTLAMSLDVSIVSVKRASPVNALVCPPIAPVPFMIFFLRRIDSSLSMGECCIVQDAASSESVIELILK